MIGNIFGMIFGIALKNDITFSFIIGNVSGVTLGIIFGVIMMNKK
jgi:hypothetical protein